MAMVNVVNMVVLDNPTAFTNPFQFEITFECLQELDDDLEWKVLYVGSAQDASRDQVLDEILVGPVPVGTNKFVLQADAPDPSQLPPEDLLGVTVVLVTCSYKEREFVRVGYYVNNEYHDPNAPPVLEGEEPPAPPQPIPLEFIQRHILADKPRVTKFPISWGDELPQQQQQQQQTPPAMTMNQQQQPPQLQTPSGIVSMQEESNLSAVAMMEQGRTSRRSVSASDLPTLSLANSVGTGALAREGGQPIHRSATTT